MIQDVFKELDPYLKGLKIVENYNVVEVLFKKTWKYRDFLPEDIEFSQTQEHANKNYHHGALYSENQNFDGILNIIREIVKINLEEEEKESLLKLKVEELKKTFQSNSLSELKSLTFIYDIKNGVTEKLQPQEELAK